MKRCCWILACLLCAHGVYAQDIVQLEYYIDTDPGFGNATQVSITPDTSLSVSFTADLSGLDDGFHVLYVRARDDSSRWSLTIARPFLKDDLTSSLPPDVTAVEYYIDTDPGFGLGTPVPIPAAPDTSVSFAADLSGLDDGFHVLYVRARDANGHWSLTQARAFLKDDLTLASPFDVTAVEYYIDTDPGFGNATPIPVTPGPDLSLSFTADLSGLGDGFHVLYVRTRDADGRWSLTQTRAFLKESTEVETNVVAVEYYFVKDGVPTAPILFDSFPPAPDVGLNFNADLSGLDVDSTYTMYIRGIDADGTPSLEMVHEFTVDAPIVHTISGTVSDTNGLPVGGVMMTLTSVGPDTTEATTTTETNGAYAFLSAEESLDHTVTPSRDFCTFTPPGQTFLNLLQDEQADFTADCPPRITVAPTSFATSLAPGDSTTETLTVGNLGRDTLSWQINQSSTWLSVAPDTGTVGPEDSIPVAVTLDATGLGAGIYADTLVVTSNDPNQPTVLVPISLTVLAPEIALSDTTLDFGGVFVGASDSLMLTISNMGSATLQVSDIASDIADFTVVVDSLTLDPDSSAALTVSFTPSGTGPISGTLTITSNDPFSPLVTVALTGEGVSPPVVEVTPASLSASLAAGDTTTQTLTISNTGSSDLVWTAVADAAVPLNRADPQAPVNTSPANADLEIVLDSLNANFADIIAAIPDRFGFSGGTAGTSITDGGGRMYDVGNFISTDRGGPLPYSNNLIVGSTLLGAGGRYATVKYPGLFVLAADLGGVEAFEIDGNLGADGNGSVDSAVLQTTVQGTAYTGFVKRVFGAGTPSVNHLIIITSDVAASQAFSTNTNSDLHRVTGLTAATRLFYLLYAGADGGYIDNVATLTLMNTFLGAVGARWLSLDPTSGVVAVGQSADVEVIFDAMGLDDGTSNGSIIVTSNDPITPTVTTPVTLTVSGSHPVAVADSVSTLEDTPVTFDVLANDFDPNGDPITLDSFSQPTNGAVVQHADTTFTYTPNQDFYGTDVFTYTISDSSLVASTMVAVLVAPINDPPQITSTPATQATETRAYSYQVEVTEVDEDSLAYVLDVAPAWLSVDSLGRIAGTPPLGAADTTVTVTVNDDSSATDVQSFDLTVRLLPDLTITEIQAPAEGFTDQPIDVTWTVTNTGNGSIGSVEWFDRIYLSPDSLFNLEIARVLGTVENLTALGSGESYSNTTTVDLPDDVLGNYYIFVTADIHDNLDELDEDNNRGRSPNPIDVMFPDLPDLQVVSLITPANAFSEDSIDVTWTVQNLGDAGVGTSSASKSLDELPPSVILWFDAIYLSADPILNINDDEQLALVQNETSLAVDSSYTRTSTVVLPQGIFGNYFIFVITDLFDQVFEFPFDGNNIRQSDPINVTLTPPPDLQVESVSIPDSVTSGQSYEISWTIKNFGAGRTSTLDDQWRDEIYLSADTLFDINNDTRLSVQVRLGELEPDSSYTRTVTVSSSHRLAGTYYLLFLTDTRDNVFEFNAENNNRLIDSLIFTPIPPDFVVTSLTVPDTVSSGQSMNVIWTVQNQGVGANVESNWSDQVYLYSEPVFDPDSATALRAVLLSGNLDASISYTTDLDVTLPDGNSGDFYLYVQTDWEEEIFEFTAEDNNVRRSDTTLAVVLSPWPDLQVSSIEGPTSATAGEQILVSWTVANLGTAAADGVSWTDQLFISPDPVWNDSMSIALGSLEHPNTLGAGDTYTKSLLVTLSTNLQGSYYLHLFADVSDQVFEHTDEDNNIGQSMTLPVVAYPPIDLAVQNIMTPLSGSTGQPISVQWTVTNIGTSTTLSSAWTDSLYLSEDILLNTGQDFLLTSVDRDGGLNPGESYTRDLTVTLPNEIDGDYFLIISNTLADNNPFNNIVASTAPIGIARSPSPDLVISSLNASISGTTGQPIAVRWTIENQGDGTTQRNSWFEAIFLSADTLLGDGDVRLGTFTRSGALDPTESYTDSLVVTLPTTALGDQYLLLRTDNSDGLYEHQGEDNNIAAKLILVTQPLPADLVVTDILVPATAVPGEDVVVSWTLQNQGANPAVGQMSEAVYVSADSTWKVDDPLLGVVERTINLLPGASQSVNFKVNVSKAYRADAMGNITEELPGVTPGNYRVIVRTDIRDTIFESDGTNNSAVSSDSMNVDVPGLDLGVPVSFPISESQSRYYRVDTEDGMDLRITLTGNASGASNELYLAYDRTPTFNDFDAAANEPFKADQDLLIPSVQAGTYYLLVHGRSQAQPSPNYTLTADSLSFEILFVDTDTGGNTGQVTTKIEGARFDSLMTASLQDGGNTILADTVVFVNSTRIFATFDLTGIAEGVYDVILERSTGQVTTLAQSFNVVPGDEKPLTINVIYPQAIRSSTRTFEMTIVYSNDGNVDIPLSASILASHSGEPIGTSLNDLEFGFHSYYVLFKESNGPDYVLRPGATDAITVFGGSTGSNRNLGYQLFESVELTSSSGPSPSSSFPKDGDDQIDLFSNNSSSNPFTEFCNAEWQGKCSCIPDLCFADACTNHDACYGRCGGILDKVRCDGRFLVDMLEACIEKFPPDICSRKNSEDLGICASLATTYFAGVSTFGFFFFQGGDPQCQPGGGDPIPPDPVPPGPFCCLPFSEICFDIPLVFPQDPNDIIGPASFGDEKWIAADQPLGYTIRYENDPEFATAPAQLVTIEQTLDADLDVRTFRLGSFGFGDFVFEVPANRSFYSNRLDVTDSLGVLVDVTAGLDVTNNKIFWTFRSIDPATGQPPADPFAGFLPINDSTGVGEGFVTYIVRPRTSAQTGDVIDAEAEIVFDINEPILTPAIFNTLDADGPTSSVASLTELQDTTAFEVTWSGQDGVPGSGVGSYDLYVSEDGGPFAVHQARLTDTVLVFNGERGRTYGFYSRATDNAGNVEPAKTQAEATITLGTTPSGTASYALLTPWNLLGLPLNVADAFYKTLFPNAIDSTFFAYTKQQGYFFPDPLALEKGRGYWLRFPAPETVSFIGIQVTEITLTLDEEWNLISGPFCNVPLATVGDPGGILIPGTLYRFDKNYVLSDTLEAGRGYWLRASAPGDITLSCNGMVVAAKAKNGSRVRATLEDFGRLIISDSTEVSRRLYFGGPLPDDVKPWSYSLPPKPPGRVFDARFAGDFRLAEAARLAEPEGAAITFQAGSYPVRITVDRLPSFDLAAGRERGVLRYVLQVLADQEVIAAYDLFEGWEMEIADARVTQVRLRAVAEEVPLAFRVEQNYPNPFNPSTTIQYALPKAAKVRVDIYNVLGQRVALLLDEDQKAGYHQVVWHGLNMAEEQVASGVYFYVVEAGEKRAMRKMILVK